MKIINTEYSFCFRQTFSREKCINTLWSDYKQI